MADNKTNIIIAAIDQASATLSKIGQSMGTLGSQSAALTGLMGGLTGALSAGAFVGWIKGTIDAADSMNDLTQSVGIGIKELAGWQLAASQSGTSIEAVARGVKGLSGYMVDHADKLKAAGITATDANGAMLQLADLFADMPDGVEKTTLAVQLFGKSGLDMIPMLNQGSAGLQTAQEKAGDYAKALEQLAPKADEFNDMVEELALHSKAAGINIADYFMPGLIGLTKLLNDVARGGESARGALDWIMNESVVSNPLSRLTYKAGAAIGDGYDAMTQGGAKGYSGPVNQYGVPITGAAAVADAKVGVHSGRQRAAEARARALLASDGKSARASKPSAADELAAMNRTSDYREELRAKTMASNEAIEANAKLARQYREMADPMLKYTDQLAEIAKLHAAEALSADDAANASAKIRTEMDDLTLKMSGFKDEGGNTFADLTRAVEGWGDSFTDAFTDMLMGGKASFADLADSVIRDLIRMQVQASITKPLFDSLNAGGLFGGMPASGSGASGNRPGSGFSGVNSGSGILSGIGDFFSDLFSFADGGIMSARGALPLHKYASGGIANSPQLALFGEGRMNEAFVPLPDGRSIPVQMRGGGGDTVISMPVTIDARGASADVVPQFTAALQQLEARIYRNVPGLVSRQQLRNRITPMSA